MFKIAICDDVESVCKELKEMILEIKSDIFCEPINIDVFYSGEALLSELNDNNVFDLIFLDIELKKINGIEVGHIIRNEMDDYTTKLIYISSKSTYDRQLFDVQPFHFLQKPLDKEKIFHDIKLANKLVKKENNMFEFKKYRQHIKIAYQDILYFESKNRKIILVSINNKYDFYDKIENIMNGLPDFFVHPHKSYIVNYKHITHFKHNEFTMSNADIIPISRNKRKKMKDIQVSFEHKNLNTKF